MTGKLPPDERVREPSGRFGGGFRWTDAHTPILAELCAEGLTAREMALRIDPRGAVSRNAVIGRLGRLGLKLARLPGRKTLAPAPEKKPRKPRTPVVQVAHGPQPFTIPETSLTGLGTPLIEADFTVCRYPLWEVHGGHDHPICGELGYPWCPHHKARVFGAGTHSEREAIKTAKGITKAEGKVAA